jgi:hypothetical protein
LIFPWSSFNLRALASAGAVLDEIVSNEPEEWFGRRHYGVHSLSSDVELTDACLPLSAPDHIAGIEKAKDSKVSKLPKSGFSGNRVSASYADGCLAWIRTMTK